MEKKCGGDPSGEDVRQTVIFQLSYFHGMEGGVLHKMSGNRYVPGFFC